MMARKNISFEFLIASKRSFFSMNTRNFTKHSEKLNVLFRCIVMPFSTNGAAHESTSIMLNETFLQVEI